MATTPKQSPSITPGPSLAASLARALKDETARHAVSVRLRVRGGAPAQSYSFDFAVWGDGTAECRFTCRLSGRHGETPRTTLAPKDLAGLLTKVQRALRLPVELPSFLPDTLVGILEVSEGANVQRIYFAADPEQAKTQGKVPPREVLDAVNAMYTLGAKLTGQRSVKP